MTIRMKTSFGTLTSISKSYQLNIQCSLHTLKKKLQSVVYIVWYCAIAS